MTVKPESVQESMVKTLFDEQDTTEKAYFESQVKSSWLIKRMDEGCNCPLCGQVVKRYPRTINAEMAKVLVLLHRHFTKYPRSAPIHIDSFLSKVCGASRPKGNNHSLMVHWGLLNRVGSRISRAGKRRGGYYDITALGALFVEGQVSVPKYVYIYNNHTNGMSAEKIMINDALNTRFTMDGLMSLEPFETVEFI